jgi:predicted ATPase
MFLRSTHIQHYKSLGDVRVEFSNPITVIVGRNAAGKTNLVDALYFASETVLSLGPDKKLTSVTRRGGLRRLKQRVTPAPNRPIQIRLDFSSPESEPGNITSSIDLTITPAGSGIHKIEVTSSDDAIENRDRLVAGWRHANIYPNTLREASFHDIPQDRFLLAEDGSNWASVIQAMRQTSAGKSALKSIMDTMRLAVPEFRDIRVRAVGSFLVPHFIFESQGKATEFDPQELSDGTLRLFTLLLAIYQKPTPDLLLIDEPENTLYPGAIGILVDAIREAAGVTQFIITTHSPDFVKYFAPEEVRIATRTAGQTRIDPVSAIQTQSIKQHLLTIDEFMRAEGLQPEVPEGSAA